MRLRHEPDSYWSLIRFGLLLGLAATGWVITSAALITLLAPVPIHTPIDFIREGSVVLAVQNDGSFAPGVRETLMIVARELGRL